MKIKREMESFIIENYLYMTQKELAEHLQNGVTASDIQYWLRKNNLYKKKYMFSDTDIEFMINNYKTMEYKEMAKILGLTELQVKGKLNNMGYTKLRNFNKSYFHTIDSDLKAYFVGFIFADGWVIFNEESRNYELGLELQNKDKYILEKLSDELGNVHKIFHSNPTNKKIKNVSTISGHSNVLRVYSKDIVLDLINHGIYPQKTQKENYPTIPLEYFFDFLRGYIDGDGCYYSNKGKTYLHITCSNINPLSWIQYELNKHNIITHTYKENDKKFRLMCTQTESMKKLTSLLYHKNFSFCLDRKYKKIESLIGFAT